MTINSTDFRLLPGFIAHLQKGLADPDTFEEERQKYLLSIYSAQACEALVGMMADGEDQNLVECIKAMTTPGDFLVMNVLTLLGVILKAEMTMAAMRAVVAEMTDDEDEFIERVRAAYREAVV